MADSDAGAAAADAFVFFGATGDLAHKMIFLGSERALLFPLRDAEPVLEPNPYAGSPIATVA